MGVSLFNKYRPTEFKDVCSQDNVLRILNRQVEIKDFKNCYIFSGPSGVGKTTIARILAYKMNEYSDSNGNRCTSEPIEIDAASNNGVDNIRNIIEGATCRSLDGKYKIYIIDEAHALTSQSWNALLKTIEETPKYTVFMFCTTEYHKIPVTIQNRCQQYFLTRVPENVISDRLEYICKNENLKYEKEALDYIAKFSMGNVRQSISYLDTCVDYSEDLTIKSVLETLGKFSYDTYFELINAIIDKNKKGVSKIINDYFMSGADLKLFLEGFIDFVLDITKYQLFNSFDIIKIPKSYQKSLMYTINIDGGTEYFIHIMDKLLETKQMLKGDTNVKTTLEINLLKL